MAKALDATTAQELIEQGLRTLHGEAAVTKARPIIEAALESARLSSKAAGRRTFSVTGISVNSGDPEESTTVYQVATGGGGSHGPVVNAKKKRYPIAYGGTHYTCWMTYPGPPPTYFCIYH